MKRFLKGLGVLLLAVVLLAGMGLLLVSKGVGRGPRVAGQLAMPGLTSPVSVLRDAHGIPSIFAANTPDLIRAQGFVTAQDRLFQLEGYRALASGRLAEVVGEAGLASDRQVRLVGIRRNAVRHARLLSPQAREFLGWYAEGMNAYISGYANDHPVELRLAGFQPRPWTLDDMVTVLHFVNWSQAANFRAELTMQRLVEHLGPELVAAELLPVNVNADNDVPKGGADSAASHPLAVVSVATSKATDGQWLQRLGLSDADLLLAEGGAVPGRLPGLASAADELPIGAPPAVGSNNWAIAPSRSASGSAVLVNDPHLDVRMLPGIWHPVGLFAPGIQVVGAALPAVPGVVLGRNANVAFGVTNAYGDSQDLYVEQGVPGKPGYYFKGKETLPFKVIDEVIRVKDKRAPGGYRDEPFRILATVHGPVISRGSEFDYQGGKFLALRMASAELSGGGLGFDQLLTAQSAAQVDAAVQAMDVVYFNYVFVDQAGVIGHRASGRVPVRKGAPGSYPRVASGEEDWVGYIPPAAMPSVLAPDRGWVSTANHDTRPAGYPFEYSSYFAPSYRYRRIGQVLGSAHGMTTADQAALMTDPTNLQAVRLLPSLLAALRQDPQQADLVALLEKWDGRDTADQAAPLVYHRIYEELALQTYADEMGIALARKYLGQWYLWQERFDELLKTPNSHWFDDVATPQRESFGDIARRAAKTARADLVERYGADPQAWRWGQAHRIRFFSPLRKNGIGSDWLGRAPQAMNGSGDTVMRALTAYGEGFDVEFFASARFVADLADNDKVQAVVAGGVVDRQFHEHQRDQIQPWAEGRLLDWWFAPAQVEAHAVQRQELVPVGR